MPTATPEAAPSTYQDILVSRDGAVGLVQLNRPKALNALSPQLMGEVGHALGAFAADPAIGAVVITGNERAFAAGADIKEMADAGLVDMVQKDLIGKWDAIARFPKPLVAAVQGFCLGGGCELMMMCDLVIAADDATFGQPEVNLGVIPGAGGTQRLTRQIGKVRAMELVLTGRNFSAAEALAWGLVNRVVPAELVREEAAALAATVAAKAPVAVRMAKESVVQAWNAHLDEGLRFERRNFYALFATEDQKEGMRAFVEKRRPDWKGR